MAQIRVEKGVPVYKQEAQFKNFEKAVKLSGKLNSSGELSSEVTAQIKSLLRVGNKVIWTRDGTDYQGEITAISNRANFLSGLYDITLKLRDTPKQKVKEPYVVVEVVYEIIKGKVVVNRSSVSYRDGKPKVLVVDKDRKIHRKEIKVLDQNDSQVLVGRGIEPGELIVTSDQRYLNEGDVVHLVERREN